MDSRLDPLRDLGLERGDAMVLRNAGARLSDDVEAALRFVHHTLGVAEVWIVGHSDCAAHGGSEAAALGELRSGRARLAALLPDVSVRLRFYELATGALRAVEPPG
jgi:carbonic anhydrase